MSDLISRQAVINRIANTCFWLSGKDWNELIDCINSISSVANMSDPISRQAVINTLDNMDNALDEERTVEKYKELLTECIKVLPSAENKGEWIRTKDQYETYHFTCSRCGNDIATKSDAWDDNYCSECGAKMVEP